MIKAKWVIVCLWSLSLIVVLSATKAESFDPEAISQVSKGIAEWKLMNEGKGESQVEPGLYVSSSLAGMIEKGGGEGVGVVEGLAAFDNDYWIKSEIRQWELNRQVDVGSRYMTRLPTNPGVDVGGDITTKTIGIAYQQYMHNQFAVVNVFRGYQSKPALATFPASWHVASTTYDIASLGMGAGTTFIQTIDRIGTSMQIMNPPIYLQNNPKFTPSQKILGVPISGTWEGSGSYRIPVGIVNYQETLKTSGPGPITQTHTDWVTTNMGTYYRHVEIKTPASSGFERFVLTHYPVGRYWDPQSSVTYTITRSQQSYRIKTIGGMSKVTPLPSSGVGTWNYRVPGSNIPQVFRSSTVMPTYTLTIPTYTMPKPPRCTTTYQRIGNIIIPQTICY